MHPHTDLSNNSCSRLESKRLIKPSVNGQSHCKHISNGCKNKSINEEDDEPLAKRRRHSGMGGANHLQTNSSEQSPGSVTLEPYVHQVTGRSHMLALNSTTICKSLIPRELLFYTSIPEDLKPFVPDVKGVLYAQLAESEENRDYKFSTSQVFMKSNPVNISPHSSRSDGRDWVPAYDKVLFKGLERFEYSSSHGFTSHPWTVDKDIEAVTESVGANPWAIRQHKREINRMLSLDESGTDTKSLDHNENKVQDVVTSSHVPGIFVRGYLMLEDVSTGFRHPSVIDFKLGRQIERNDCSQEKKNKHVELAKNSSTGTLMLRLAGMQVYQVNTGHYLCRDKYYGRGLSASGFKESVNQFLHNGSRYLIEVIPPIIEKLKTLLKILEKQDTFRFHASSLLVLYEGDDIQDSSNSENQSSNEMTEPERKIEVKLIDFAHSTYKGFNGDRTLYSGPDHDCLQAISNIITMLQELESKVLNR
ncbi:inositol hexakisphosphate kinase 1-like [Styela clava]